MPDIGDIVTYYTLDSWDGQHRVADSAAIVLAEVPGPDDSPTVLRLQVFQWGVAPFQAEVSEFPDEAPVDAAGNPVYGGNYWREADADAPDFGERYAKLEDAKPEPEPIPEAPVSSKPLTL